MADDTSLIDLHAHAYEYVQQQPGAKWLVTYVQDVARFSRRVYFDLAERYQALGRASVTPFRAVEVDCQQRIAPEGEFETGAARPHELAALAARIRAKRPAIYIEATGLGSPDLSIDPTIIEWAAAGLQRERQVLVARGPSGWPVAAAVLDAANDGLHLFGLLDVVRIFPLVEGAGSAYATLLAACQDWFSALGKHRFTYFADDDEDALGAGRTGCTDLGAAYVTILPVALLPELLEHVFTLTARCAPPSRGPTKREGAQIDLRFTPPVAVEYLQRSVIHNVTGKVR